VSVLRVCEYGTVVSSSSKARWSCVLFPSCDRKHFLSFLFHFIRHKHAEQQTKV